MVELISDANGNAQYIALYYFDVEVIRWIAVSMIELCPDKDEIYEYWKFLKTLWMEHKRGMRPRCLLDEAQMQARDQYTNQANTVT